MTVVMYKARREARAGLPGTCRVRASLWDFQLPKLGADKHLWSPVCGSSSRKGIRCHGARIGRGLQAESSKWEAVLTGIQPDSRPGCYAGVGDRWPGSGTGDRQFQGRVLCDPSTASVCSQEGLGRLARRPALAYPIVLPMVGDPGSGFGCLTKKMKSPLTWNCCRAVGRWAQNPWAGTPAGKPSWPAPVGSLPAQCLGRAAGLIRQRVWLWPGRG